MRRLNGPKVREIRSRSVRLHKRAESALPEGAEGLSVESALGTGGKCMMGIFY